ncbi:MAG: SHOCT domain-containing protein [Acidimicrobiia bacterium]
MAFGAYKMSKRDADRIQQHTGVPPEELEDHELEQAMDQLGIEKQQVTSEDQEEGGGTPTESTGTGSYLDELERLSQLKDQGVITEDEFEAKKKQILGL